MYTSSCGDMLVFVVRRKRSMKVNGYIYFQVDLFVGTPVDELKGHCAGYAEKEEINRTGITMNWYICAH